MLEETADLVLPAQDPPADGVVAVGGFERLVHHEPVLPAPFQQDAGSVGRFTEAVESGIMGFGRELRRYEKAG